MSEHTFQFAVLRYIHDPVTQEFLNVGIVVYSREARYLKASVSTRYSRLSDAFQGINGEHYRRVVTHIERRIAWVQGQTQQPKLLGEPPDKLESILSRVLLPDDSSMAFGGYGSGLSEDLDAELARLHHRLVAKYAEKEDLVGRDDADVWRAYRPALEEFEITLRLNPVTIRTQTYHYEFPRAWKNERWNPLESVSFDLVHPRSILNKADRWLGTMTNLAESDQMGTLYMLLGAPTRPEVQGAYEDSVANLLRRPPLNLVTVQETEAVEFSRSLAEHFAAHQVIGDSRDPPPSWGKS